MKKYNRRQFFKKAGIVSTGVIVGPKILAMLPTKSLSAPIPPIKTIPIIYNGPCYVNVTNQISVLKEIYADKIEDLVYQEKDFLKMVKRD